LTLPVAPDSVAWTGLEPPQLTWDARIHDGLGVNAGRLVCSLHTGTHADAPLHVLAGGSGSEALPPEAFIGPAWVVRLPELDRIEIEELMSAVPRPFPVRLLLATARPFDGVRFPVSVPALAPAAARWLVEQGVRLVGVDQPSLDPLESRTMEAHRILFGGGAFIVENLRLADVEAGPIELVALPLLIAGADAAPVRALARRPGSAGRDAPNTPDRAGRSPSPPGRIRGLAGARWRRRAP
jgi:arylformamidase